MKLFPQEERLINNEYSINLPARYKLKRKTKKKLDQYYQSISWLIGDW